MFRRGRRRAENERLQQENDRLREQLHRYELGWPPGHFYSPIPSLDEVRAREEQIFGNIPDEIPGIDLQVPEQLRLLDRIKQYYPEQPFGAEKQAHLRFYFENPNFSYGEALVLYGLIRHLHPKRIIEIGSGHSSCAILDTNQLFFGGSIACVFVEPYPELLESLLLDGDLGRVEVVREKIQQVDLERFSEPSAGDVLFVDSSHVSKVDSDVNHIVFNILPRLASGVFVHFHDVAYPFEYPREWVYQGRAWNEVYLLRAFLQYSSAFRIRLFNSYLGRFHPTVMETAMPLAARNFGTSLWIEKARM
jgi:hypothetical protein